jgi:hypothetical protein
MKSHDSHEIMTTQCHNLFQRLGKTLEGTRHHHKLFIAFLHLIFDEKVEHDNVRIRRKCNTQTLRRYAP